MERGKYMHTFIISGKKLLIAASSCLAAVLVAVGAGLLIAGKAAPTSAQPKKVPIYSVKTEEKKIALTFDAAWGNSDTDRLIEILKKHNAKATFFATGEWVDKYPDDVKKLTAAGHDIQNHSDKHPHVAKISAKDVIKDAKNCDDKIEALTGKRPTLYRAPYGEYSKEMLEALEKEGMQVIQWNVDSRDWKRPSVETMVSSVTKAVTPGSILLFHNDVPNTPAALDAILTQLDKNGYQYMLVSDLILKDNYTIDSNGVQSAKP